MFVRLNLNKWEGCELEATNFIFPKVILSKPDNGSIGFLEVFDTKEDAVKVYGDDVRLAEFKFL